MFRTGYLAAAGLVLLAGPATAADLIIEEIEEVAIVSDSDWTGFYAGVHGGLAWSAAGYEVGDPGGAWPLGAVDADDISASNFLAGVQVGYNWDMDGLIFGIQGSASVGLGGEEVEEFSTGSLTDPSFEDSSGGGHYQGVIVPSIDWLSTFTAKVGFDAGSFMPYVTGGLAAASLTDTVYYDSDVGGFTEFSASRTEWGFVAGVGAEVAVAEGISLFAEYNYVSVGGDGGDDIVVDDGVHGAITVSPEDTGAIHVAKAGLNFKF
jgi:outer membrane immunogenic protein